MVTRYSFDPLVRKWIIIGLVIASILVSCILLWAILNQGPGQFEYWKIALDAIKLVVVGLLVAYLGILIPWGSPRPEIALRDPKKPGLRSVMRRLA